MRKKKKELVILMISMIVICVNHIVLSKYDYVANCSVQSEIAKAVFVVEKDEIIKQQIDQKSFPIEYNFTIHNFQENKINEVDFAYIIEIHNSTGNFPFSYFLLDCDNNTEIQILDGKTETIYLQKHKKESRKFKLYLQWRELDGALAESVSINLRINAVQIKGGKIDENTTYNNYNSWTYSNKQ